MVYRDTLLVFLNKFFEPFAEKAKKDIYGANGLQLEGKDEIKKIALGVSISLELIEKTVKKEADCLIVHHGLNLNLFNHRIDTILKNRLNLLLEKKITLIGYHFLLDHHPEIGNNASLIKKLGGQILEPFYDEWGWIGEFKEKQDLEKVIKEASKIYESKPFTLLKGPKKIQKFGVLSGAGAPHPGEIVKFLDPKIELLITGEVKESTPALLSEAKINFASFGHYNTEKIGIKNLGEIIKKQFYVEVEFIDIPNEL